MGNPVWMNAEQMKYLSDAHDGERCARLPYCTICDLIARVRRLQTAFGDLWGWLESYADHESLDELRQAYAAELATLKPRSVGETR